MKKQVAEGLTPSCTLCKWLTNQRNLSISMMSASQAVRLVGERPSAIARHGDAGHRSSITSYSVQAAAQSNLRADASSTFPRAGQAESVSDCRRAPHARPCAHVPCDPPKHPVASVIGFRKGRALSPLPGCVARSGILRVSISGPAATPSPRSGLNWSRSANTSASRTTRMEQAGNSESLSQAQLFACIRWIDHHHLLRYVEKVAAHGRGLGSFPQK